MDEKQHPIALHEYQLTQLDTRVTDLEARIQALSEWKAGLESTIQGLNDTLSRLEAAVTGLSNKLENLTGQGGRKWERFWQTLTTVTVTLILTYLWSQFTGGSK
jgi:uncharacterized coiled-coil protein SlyX